jgi:hypothetical protein
VRRTHPTFQGGQARVFFAAANQKIIDIQIPCNYTRKQYSQIIYIHKRAKMRKLFIALVGVLVLILGTVAVTHYMTDNAKVCADPNC